MINSKAKGYGGEIQYRDLLRRVFGCKVERQFASGAFDTAKGDIMPNTLPEVLKDLQPEIKYCKNVKLRDWVQQCQREFNSKNNWHIAYRCPAEWEITDNFIIMAPACVLLEMLKELDDLRKNVTLYGRDAK